MFHLERHSRNTLIIIIIIIMHISPLQVRLGNAQETPAIGSIVVTSLCPAIERVVRDGMKSCLTGLQIFGKVQLSPWRVTESSAEIGESCGLTWLFRELTDRTFS